MNDYKQVIGENLEKILKAKGLSYLDLASKTGVRAKRIGEQIRGEGISLENAFKYVEALGCSLDDLFGGVVDEKKFEPVCDIYGLYPYNMILDALDGNKEELDDVYSSAFWHVYESLTPREKDVLEMYYKKHMTLKEIGDKYSRTGETIRRIKAKGLRKIAHRKRLYIFDAVAVLEENRKLKLEMAKKDAIIQSLSSCSDKLIENALVPIDELGLSVRSYNCLHRAGYEYVSDFAGKNLHDIFKIRNLGAKSLEEILGKLKNYGVEFELS